VTFLEAAIRAGVKVAAGNDGGAPLVQNGEIVAELQLYVDHGMTPLQALASATTVTAELCRLEDVGLVEPGYVADLLVVDADPLASVTALEAPRHVIQAGRVVASRG
jgi:imidazolonepropionase-like amidohydrolase